jgi:hypothetical protein
MSAKVPSRLTVRSSPGHRRDAGSHSDGRCALTPDARPAVHNPTPPAQITATVWVSAGDPSRETDGAVEPRLGREHKRRPLGDARQDRSAPCDRGGACVPVFVARSVQSRFSKSKSAHPALRTSLDGATVCRTKGMTCSSLASFAVTTMRRNASFESTRSRGFS